MSPNSQHGIHRLLNQVPAKLRRQRRPDRLDAFSRVKPLCHIRRRGHRRLDVVFISNPYTFELGKQAREHSARNGRVVVAFWSVGVHGWRGDEFVREDGDFDVGLDDGEFDVKGREFVGQAVAVAFYCPLGGAVDSQAWCADVCSCESGGFMLEGGDWEAIHGVRGTYLCLYEEGYGHFFVRAEWAEVLLSCLLDRRSWSGIAP